jgi:hypothetical protein
VLAAPGCAQWDADEEFSTFEMTLWALLGFNAHRVILEMAVEFVEKNLS